VNFPNNLFSHLPSISPLHLPPAFPSLLVLERDLGPETMTTNSLIKPPTVYQICHVLLDLTDSLSFGDLHEPSHQVRTQAC